MASSILFATYFIYLSSKTVSLVRPVANYSGNSVFRILSTISDRAFSENGPIFFYFDMVLIHLSFRQVQLDFQPSLSC